MLCNECWEEAARSRFSRTMKRLAILSLIILTTIVSAFWLFRGAAIALK